MLELEHSLQLLILYGDFDLDLDFLLLLLLLADLSEDTPRDYNLMRVASLSSLRLA